MNPETFLIKINKPSHFKVTKLMTMHLFSTVRLQGEKNTLWPGLNFTFFHISTTLAAYASMWMYLCLWSWLILAPGLNSDCMKRSRKAGTRIWRKWTVHQSLRIMKKVHFLSDTPSRERDIKTFLLKRKSDGFLKRSEVLTTTLKKSKLKSRRLQTLQKAHYYSSIQTPSFITRTHGRTRQQETWNAI